MGWKLLEANAENDRLEATVTTKLYDWKDDVVIQLEEGTADSNVFDILGKSLIERSDIDANACRIRAFTSALNDKLMVE